MSGPERIVLLVNAAEALVAAWANMRAVKRLPAGPLAHCFSAVAVFAIFYACGYTWLFFSGEVLIWSSTLRGVSTVVWPVVWIWPSVAVANFIDEVLAATRVELETTKGELAAMRERLGLC